MSNDSMKRQKQYPLRITIFCCLLLSVIYLLSKVFVISDKRVFQTWSNFYSEKNKLDAVYIGASNVYPFWASPISWNDYGYTVYPLAVPDMPAKAIKYYIEEARKTQKDALYIISLNDFKNTEEISIQAAHLSLDRMRMSKTKIEMINSLFPDITDEDAIKAELYFPLIRFHSRWDELETADFEIDNNGLKGASTYPIFLTTSNDISESFQTTEERYELSQSQTEVLDDLLSYCDETDINVLFVIVPQAINNKQVIGQLNRIGDIVSDRGFRVLNMLNKYEEIGLQIESDYYNENHLNIHGCLKYTKYFSDYLMKNYSLIDNRSADGYQSWNKAYKEYLKVINPYVVDFELDGSLRDYSIKTPVIYDCRSVNKGIKVCWEKVGNCNAYKIYRKMKNSSNWEPVAEVDAAQNSFYDDHIDDSIEYQYHVVPVRIDETKTYYGNYDYNSASTIHYYDAPKLSVSGDMEHGIKLTWNPVEDIDGYQLLRSEDNENWIVIADVSNNTTEFTDMISEPKQYYYSICAYTGAEELKKYGAMVDPGIAREVGIDEKLQNTEGTKE